MADLRGFGERRATPGECPPRGPASRQKLRQQQRQQHPPLQPRNQARNIHTSKAHYSNTFTIHDGAHHHQPGGVVRRRCGNNMATRQRRGLRRAAQAASSPLNDSRTKSVHDKAAAVDGCAHARLVNRRAMACVARRPSWNGVGGLATAARTLPSVRTHRPRPRPAAATDATPRHRPLLPWRPAAAAAPVAHPTRPSESDWRSDVPNLKPPDVW